MPFSPVIMQELMKLIPTMSPAEKARATASLRQHIESGQRVAVMYVLSEMIKDKSREEQAEITERFEKVMSQERAIARAAEEIARAAEENARAAEENARVARAAAAARADVINMPLDEAKEVLAAVEGLLQQKNSGGRSRRQKKRRRTRRSL